MLNERQKVIVVDDKYDEIRDFLSALWKMGIPCIYLNGQPENLPKEHFHGVRIIFLDIVLGNEGTSEKNKAAPVANVIKHIVGDAPEPYFIVFWTKHPELIEHVLHYLTLDKILPVGYSCLDKPYTLNDIKKIMKDIKSKISELDAFKYLLNWENIVEKASSNFSTNLFSTIPAKGESSKWSDQVNTLLGSLSLAYTEHDSLNNNTEDIRNAFLMMTDSFKDSLQQIIKLENLNDNTSLSNKQLTLEQISKINSSLFIDFKTGKKPSLGNIFIYKKPKQYLYDALINNIFKNPSIANDIEVVGMIITPACDLANNKYLHNGKNCFRVLYGLLIPIPNSTYIKKNLKLGNNQQQSLLNLAPFWYKDLPYIIVFHFGSLSSVWYDKDKEQKFIFNLKEHLAFDIQSKMANHANRLGNSMIHPQ